MAASDPAMKIPDRMRAIQITRFGGPEVLELVEVSVPEPGPWEVLVRLEVAGINYSDISWRTGRRGGELPIVDGSEGAGTIAALGSGVEGLTVGDRVAYWNPAMGSYAEYATCPAFRIVKLPKGMDFGTGAALMLQGLTAHYLVRSVFPVGEGCSLLFHAGAGGVGQILIQIAKANGARVLTTVGSAEKAVYVREIGADEAILYTDVNFNEAVRALTNGEGVNVVFDAIGAATWEGSIDSLKRRGTVVFFGGASGPVPVFDTALLSAKGSLTVSRPMLGDFVRNPEEISWRVGEMIDLWGAGQLLIRIGATYPLADVATAHTDLEGRRTTGKLLLGM
ncbi:quinone oxidoreductase [Alphaproteobacteria bacterium]|nr:quinone oxidoreductase [Alphaproteobacteria bacterium]